MRCCPPRSILGNITKRTCGGKFGTDSLVVVVVVVVVVIVVVVVEWLYYSERIIIVRWADLSDLFFVDFRR